MPQLETTEYFEEAARGLDEPIKRKLAKALRLLEADVRHPGLQTHPIPNTRNPKVYSARVDDDFRLTYHRGNGDLLILRNVGKHKIVDIDP